MNMNEIRSLAKDRGINSGKLRKIELIRTIQSGENNDPCYATEQVKQCGQMECLWRTDCEKNLS